MLTDEAGEQVKAAVTGLGYRYYHIDEDARTIAEVNDLVRRSYYNYLICSEAVAERVSKTGARARLPGGRSTEV